MVLLALVKGFLGREQVSLLLSAIRTFAKCVRTPTVGVVREEMHNADDGFCMVFRMCFPENAEAASNRLPNRPERLCLNMHYPRTHITIGRPSAGLGTPLL